MDCGEGAGSIFSPRPVQREAPVVRKNGMSEPSDAASSCMESTLSLKLLSRFNPSKVIAASLLPPPSPAPWGIVFLSKIAQWHRIPAADS